MSQEYEGQDLLDIAKKAETDINSAANKEGRLDGTSDSTKDSGVDESATNKFPGSTVTVGSAASGAGDNREIPVEEGGTVNKATGQLHKAGDFEGAGGPEDKAAMEAETNPGSDDVRGNIR